MSESLDKLEANAEPALDLNDTTVVVPLTLARVVVVRLEEEIERLRIVNKPDGWHERVIANYYLSDELRELLHDAINETEDGEFVVFSIFEPD